MLKIGKGFSVREVLEERVIIDYIGAYFFSQSSARSWEEFRAATGESIELLKVFTSSRKGIVRNSWRVNNTDKNSWP